jgi:hypothetical protein
LSSKTRYVLWKSINAFVYDVCNNNSNPLWCSRAYAKTKRKRGNAKKRLLTILGGSCAPYTIVISILCLSDECRMCVCGYKSCEKHIFRGVYNIRIRTRIYYTIFVTFLEFNQMYVRVSYTVRATSRHMWIAWSRYGDNMYTCIWLVEWRAPHVRFILTNIIYTTTSYLYVCVSIFFFFYYMESDALSKNTFRQYVRNAKTANAAVYWFNGLVPFRFGILTLSTPIVYTSYI